MKDEYVPSYEAGAASAPSVTCSGLLAQAAQADAEAWSRLAQLYGPLVYGWCRRAGLRAEDASDIVQEVFQSVYLAIATFRRDRPGDSFRSWLKTITRNKIRDLWRRQQRQPAAIGGSDARRYFDQLPNVEELQVPDEPGEMDQVYRRALELLRGECEPTTWEAFRQLAVEGRSPSDVAAALGISRNAVYIARSRVLSRFRTMFAELIDTAETNCGNSRVE